jgi:catechol 2,3-dioxygenase-like lactoylglutathione lyase family enzyme
VPLNQGERRFVEDLKAFCDAHPERLAERELYLLRNQSKGRGVGFFEAGNFHPDFIVWQLDSVRQRVAFVDPKGIRNLPLEDPKINFYETVKEIEQRLGDPNVTLDSFVVSNTPSHVMRKQWRIEKAEMLRRNILFQEEDRDGYIGTLLATPGAD